MTSSASVLSSNTEHATITARAQKHVVHTAVTHPTSRSFLRRPLLSARTAERDNTRARRSVQRVHRHEFIRSLPIVY